jgi:hypothetical protein
VRPDGKEGKLKLKLREILQEDLDVFVDPEELGTAATISRRIKILFSQEFRITGGVEDLYPVALAKSGDVAGVKHGDIVVINWVEREVIGIQPGDGGLMTELILSKD